MEPLTETIDLDIEESNELAFKIKMEGASSSPAKVRLVCEGEDFSYMFNGYGTGEPEVVQFTLPRMGNKISEGTYTARVEVLVENRYFAPLNFQINFKKTVSVVAEAIQVRPKTSHSEIKVTALPIAIQRPQTQQVSQVVFEQRPQTKVRPNPPRNQVVSAPSASTSKGFSSLKEAYQKKVGLSRGGEDD